MNVLSSYRWNSRSGLRAHDTSKIAISKCGFLCSRSHVLPSLLSITIVRITRRVVVVNKPPLLSLRNICGQSPYRNVVLPSCHRHITKLNGMTLSKRAHRAFDARSSLLSARALNCEMPMNVDNIF